MTTIDCDAIFSYRYEAALEGADESDEFEVPRRARNRSARIAKRRVTA
jgi:hypothetical protein